MFRVLIASVGPSFVHHSLFPIQGLEGAIKLIVKKFPIMEIKSHSKELSPVNNIKADVIKALSLYYYTFVDLLDFKVGNFSVIRVNGK